MDRGRFSKCLRPFLRSRKPLPPRARVFRLAMNRSPVQSRPNKIQFHDRQGKGINMDSTPAIPNEDFWSNAPTVTLEQIRLTKEDKPQILLLGPSAIDPLQHRTIPVTLYQKGTREDFLEGSFTGNGILVLVDQDRNRVLTAPPEKPMNFQPAAPRPGQPEAPLEAPKGYGGSGTKIDLAARFFPEIDHTLGRYRLMGVLPRIATRPLSFRIGPVGPDFETKLRESLGRIPQRTSVPEELSDPKRPWKAISVPSDLPEGIVAEFSGSKEHPILTIGFALPELPGERIQLAPGAVMPDGTLPPEGVKRLHLLFCFEGFFYRSATLELPAHRNPRDALRRGRYEVDLIALEPTTTRSGLVSVYLFSGASALGPMILDPAESAKVNGTANIPGFTTTAASRPR